MNKITTAYIQAKANKLTPNKAIVSVEKMLSEVYYQQGLDGLIETLSDIFEKCIPKAKDAEAIAKNFFNISAGGGDVLGDETALFFERMAEQFPNSAKLAEYLGDVYGEIINEATDAEKYTHKLEELMKNNPALENAALQHAYSQDGIIMDNSSEECKIVDGEIVRVEISAEEAEKKYQKSLKAVENLKKLYEERPKRDFVRTYMKGLEHFLYDDKFKTDIEAAFQIVVRMENIFDSWQSDRFICGKYLSGLHRLAVLSDKNGCEAIIAKMEKLRETLPEQSHNTLAMNLAYTLADYCKHIARNEKQTIIAKIREQANLWQPAENLAYEIEAEIYS